jgi:hypothetical protein
MIYLVVQELNEASIGRNTLLIGANKHMTNPIVELLTLLWSALTDWSQSEAVEKALEEAKNCEWGDSDYSSSMDCVDNKEAK